MAHRPVADTSAEVFDQVLADFAEDDDTAWAPDVLGRADFAELSLEYSSLSVKDACLRPHLHTRRIDVPRPGGGFLTAYDLPFADRLLLHQAVEQIRSVSDSLLAPSVCGYRLGASDYYSHRSEYQRFREFTAALAEDVEVVITADVAKFFDSVTLERAAVAVADAVGSDAAAPIVDIARNFSSRGLTKLPAGYGDARLLGNMVLCHVDSRLSVPFTRWVDDYRLFVNLPQVNIARATDELTRALATCGLHLNAQKLTTRRASRNFYQDAPLTSVYHPTRESMEVTTASLRSVFTKAVQDPIRFRREIRFTLPRLAEIGDPVAVDFACMALTVYPWEAPRAVAYLSRFLWMPDVSNRISRAVKIAADRADAWLLARLAPIGCRIDLALDARESIRLLVLKGAENAVAWSAALRMLSRAGDRATVEAASNGEIADHRAMLAALYDADRPLTDSPRSVEAEPATARLISNLPSLPTPVADSSL